jgi:thymidylate kinase
LFYGIDPLKETYHDSAAQNKSFYHLKVPYGIIGLPMIIGFVGTPASGKTTIATKMFCFLKEQGANCELITEEARKYIASYRVINKLAPQDPISLTDKDQIEIFKKQNESENIMKTACPRETIILSDSSIYNAYIYTSDPTFNVISNSNNWSTRHYDLIFFCHPIVNLKTIQQDSNRIHDLSEFEALNVRALKILELIKPHNNVVQLIGTQSLELRYKDACSDMMSKYAAYVQGAL